MRDARRDCSTSLPCALGFHARQEAAPLLIGGLDALSQSRHLALQAGRLVPASGHRDGDQADTKDVVGAGPATAVTTAGQVDGWKTRIVRDGHG